MPANRQSIEQCVKYVLNTKKSAVAAMFTQSNGELDRLKSMLLFHDITVAQWLAGQTLATRPVPATLTAENQSTYYLPDLKAQPVHPTNRFPWVAAIEQAGDAICAELQRVLDNREKFFATRALRHHPEKLVGRGKWEVFYFYRNARVFSDNLKQCPDTAAALMKAPLFNTMPCGMAYYSIIAPGTRIRRHKGPTNLRLRCHLGLRIPRHLHIIVGGRRFYWQANQCLILDDAFPHEVIHEGASERIVLCFDIWHPDLSTAEVNALNHIFRMIPA